MRKTHNRLGWLPAVIALTILALILTACQTATPETINTVTPAPTDTKPTPTDAPAAEEVAGTPAPIVLEGATTTDTGLQYLDITPGTGDTPQAGDLVTMQYIATLPDGTELANTYTSNGPITTVWGADRLLPGWEEGVGMMKTGGKAKLVLPPELAFGETGSGGIPPNSQIILEVELLSTEPAPTPTEVAAEDLTKAESGLQYFDITEGKGAEAVDKSSVSTNYTVWVKNEDGFEYIDQSDEASPVAFVVGRGDTVFPGWDEGVTGMKVGGKRYLVIPPDLAMGEQGNGLIPPNATLVMEIELVDVREPQVATEVDEADYTTTESGLKYYDLVEGSGASPTTGQSVTVHYTGWLEDGTVFDSSVDRGQPFSFQIGTGGVIPGWDEGVASMKVGGKRQLVVPADLAYGDTGAGSTIPPGATLIFEVELLDVQ